MRAIAVAILAACGSAAPPPQPLRGTAPPVVRGDPVLIYRVTKTPSTFELRWISSDGAHGGLLETSSEPEDLARPVAGPDGTWMLGTIFGHHARHELVLARRTTSSVGLTHVDTWSESLVSPDGTEVMVTCAGKIGACVAPLTPRGTSAGDPVSTERWESVVGWVGHELLLASHEQSMDVYRVDAIDPATNTRRWVGNIRGTQSIGTDPSGRVMFATDLDERTVHVGTGFDATVPATEPRWRLIDATLVTPKTLLVREVHGDSPPTNTLLAFTAAGRTVVAAHLHHGFAALPDRVAFVDADTHELVVTDLAGQHRRVLARGGGDDILAPLVWLR